MNIRQYADIDLPAIQELHRKSKLDYALPPMGSFFSKRIVDDGTIGMVAMMRLNAEVFLICNPTWRSPAWRWEAVKKLHAVCAEDARAVGAQEAIAFLPPQIQKFGIRLSLMGWNRCRSDWPCYWRSI